MSQPPVADNDNVEGNTKPYKNNIQSLLKLSGLTTSNAMTSTLMKLTNEIIACSDYLYNMGKKPDISISGAPKKSLIAYMSSKASSSSSSSMTSSGFPVNLFGLLKVLQVQSNMEQLHHTQHITNALTIFP